jgi:hypothetical protein
MVFIVDENLRTYSEQEISNFETEKNLSLPEDYKHFLSKYGDGIYCGYLRIHALGDIASRTIYLREILREYPEFFWPASDSVLTKIDSQSCYALADSIDGDTLAYEPASKRLILFPRHGERAICVEGVFENPLNLWNALGIESPLYLEVFSPVHNKISKRIILQGKKIKEDIHLHANKVEAIHQPGTYLRLSEENAEIFYSKRWAGRMQLDKYNTLHGDRLSISFDFNKAKMKQVETDLKRLFLSEYEVIRKE